MKHLEKTGLAFCSLCAGVRSKIHQDFRYAHSLRVARLAAKLAHRHGEDPYRARIAGLLHDVARLWPIPDLLAGCAERNLQLDDFERANPIILHARVGAAVAREQFGVNDAGILQAIERHTVGAVEMSPLDAIVFIADGLEPGRAFTGRAELEALAMRDLDAGLMAVYTSTKEYLYKRGLAAAPQLEAALARYGRMRP